MNSWSLTVLAILATHVISQPRHTAAEPPPFCDGGTFYNASSQTCKPCPAGTYRDRRHDLLTTCRPCPAGTYQTHTGVVARTFCLPCAPNRFSKPAATTCDKCPKGRVGIGAECIRCPAGSYINADGICTICPLGSFSATANVRRCTPCRPGTRSKKFRRVCKRIRCPVRTEWVAELRTCRACATNTFSMYGGRCKPCPDSFENGVEIPSTCRKCPPGKYDTDPTAHVRKCAKCPDGTTTKTAGKSVCHPKNGLCPTGSFADIEGGCVTCQAHERFNFALGLCVACASNSWSHPASVACIQCPGGQIRDTRAGRFPPCSCPVGKTFMNGMCRPCPRGTRWLDSETCVPCGVGEAAPKVGSTSCTPCPFGTWSYTTGGKSCAKYAKCPDGYMLATEHTQTNWPLGTCLSVRTGCPKNLQAGSINSRGNFLCHHPTGFLYCPRDTHYDGEDGCVRCEKGLRMVARSTRRWCMKCRNGGTARGGKSEVCVTCRPGFVVGQGFCECPRNWYVTEDDKCVRCQAPGVGVDRALGCEERTVIDV